MRAGRTGPVSGDGFYSHVMESYDSLARFYDEDIGTNVIGHQMRDAVRVVLARHFRPGQRVFEIGCGTGTDAIWLAQRGVHVVATDISPEMVETAARKVRAAGLTDLVTCRQVAAKDIGTLGTEFGPGSFDGGYCHAGALNMEPELGSAVRGIGELIAPRGAFVCSVINKTSLFELLAYSASLRPRKAYRRLGNAVPIPISRQPPRNATVVASRFYAPREIIRAFRDEFRAEAVQGLRVLLPPSNMVDWYALTRPLFVPLERLEERATRRWPVNEWGHHTLFTLRRV